ncbi:hypothetical protein H4Q26_015395 [Puccinia striiformis f. sp. tritici PST-130]|nr:hypothetical protein H4Q26_015395 [Puccinia striiformis f. sp. tritici PST-130]
MASNKPPGWDIFGGGGLARRLTEDPNQFSNEVSGESCKYVAARSIRLVCGRTSREIMAGFIEKGLGGLTLNASENDQLRQQGDLVIKGFGVLAKTIRSQGIAPITRSRISIVYASIFLLYSTAIEARTGPTGVFNSYGRKLRGIALIIHSRLDIVYASVLLIHSTAQTT